jgi:hypothetical protein
MSTTRALCTFSLDRARLRRTLRDGEPHDGVRQEQHPWPVAAQLARTIGRSCQFQCPRHLQRSDGLGPPLGDNEPDDGFGQDEVDERQDEDPAVHQPSHHLMAYQSPAVRATKAAAGPPTYSPYGHQRLRTP